MKFFFSLLKGLLWLVLIILFLALLTLLAWWMQWPLITGVVLLLAFLGLFLAFLGIRALFRWRDKSRFVKKVLDEQSAETKVPLSLGGMADCWQQGMNLLWTSPHRFQERIESSQPWFLTLEAGTNAFSLLAARGETVPETETSPLFWHFLSSSVLLHCREDRISSVEWQELLEKLAAGRKSFPVRGILLVFSVNDLQGRSREGLSTLGRSLRMKIEQLMLTMGRCYPVYALVQGIESLSGMQDIISVLPAEEYDTALGLVESPSADAREAAACAVRRLEDVLQKNAVEGRLPSSDMLLGLHSLREFGERLAPLFEQLVLSVSHKVSPFLCGIAFCQGQSGSSRPAFLTGLLSYVLPKVPRPLPLSGGLPFLANTRVMIMGAWLLLTFSVCALMGVNVLYQQRALTEAVSTTAPLVHDRVSDQLYRRMLRIIQLDKASESWYLPRFGQDALSRAADTMKSSFAPDVFSLVIRPILADFRARVTGQKTTSKEEEQSVAQELMWLTALVSDRLRHGKLCEETKYLFPLTVANNSSWNPVTGRLTANCVLWMEKTSLAVFAREMRDLLATALSRQEGRVFDHMVSDINTRYPAAKVCLSQFWSHMSSNDPNNYCVPSAYTSVGYKSFSGTLEDLESLDDKSRSIHLSTNAFRTDYFRRYAKYWQNFSKAFSTIRASMQEGDVFVSYSDIHSIEQMPHYRALQTVADEVKPLKDAGNEKPVWLQDSLLVDVLVDIAEFEHRRDPENMVRAMLALAGSSPDLLQRLRAETQDAKQARQMFDVAEKLKIYFDDCLSLLKILESPDKCYSLASSWFGAHKHAKVSQKKEDGQGDNTEDLYANAKKNLDAILQNIKGSHQDPVLQILPGILDFIAQGITVQTAKVVQEAWEQDVLGSSAALYRQDDVAALFGEKGVVQTFVQTNLKPFLSRNAKSLAAAEWGDIVFPFTNDGLKTLSQAEMIAARPPEDTYYVQLRSQPTLVNVDARERVDSTRLTLACQDKTFSLLNRNYPREEKFQYTVKQCGAATLEITFPSFVLSRKYDTFTDFLKDFQYGEREFVQDDFEGAADTMESAGVKNVTVRILPDNVSDVLQKEGNQLPTLPDRLTYVW
ncbi:MAG: hypothetical protein K5657_06020 [Desulfovibrio sp.]|nr:hypothetical protein [Desulfovibrio sp.]